jgi:hypothetical protein
VWCIGEFGVFSARAGCATLLPVKKSLAFTALLLIAVIPAPAQTPADDPHFTLALPPHPGQLQWQADGFKIIESSGKPNGGEIGIRASNESKKINFLAFLFVVSGQTALTGAKCRDGSMGQVKNQATGFKSLATSEIAHPEGLPVELVSYSTQGQNGKPLYSVRGFVASGPVCGDLELYSDQPIGADDPEVKNIFQSYRFDSNYQLQFKDFFVYAELLYGQQMFKAAAPLFEQALSLLKNDEKDAATMRRVVTDQAGMAYGISGDTAKSRSIYLAAIAKDPDYPNYYYSLACADAQDKHFADAKTHLQQAFARKANVLPGETLPDPSKDDSFLPYKDNQEFWAFIQTLH